MKTYDYLIVGAGLFGAVFAQEAKKAGKHCLVIDKRSHIAGNIYTRETEGIQVHEYGAHIFHTSNKEVWQYVNQFAEFNRYTNSPVANYKGEIYNLPLKQAGFYVILVDGKKDGRKDAAPMRKRLPALLLTVLLAIGPSLTSCSRETPAPAFHRQLFRAAAGSSSESRRR